MYSFPKHPMISAVIPTFGMNGVVLTERCVRTMLEQHSHLGGQLEVIVIEDTDDEETFDHLKRTIGALTKDARIYNQPNGGFAKACNHGLHESNGQVVFLVNNDIEFPTHTLQSMADAVIATRAGMIGTRLLYPDGRIQHAGVVFVPAQNAPVPGYFDHVLRFQDARHPQAITMRPSLVTGALIGIPRTTIDVVGCLDERFLFTAEDIDYCLKVIEYGMDSIYFGYTWAIHAEGATRGRTPEEKMKLMPDVAEKEMKSLALFFDVWNGVNWANFMA